eukprot:gene3565-2516_t
MSERRLTPYDLLVLKVTLVRGWCDYVSCVIHFWWDEFCCLLCCDVLFYKFHVVIVLQPGLLLAGLLDGGCCMPALISSVCANQLGFLVCGIVRGFLGHVGLNYHLPRIVPPFLTDWLDFVTLVCFGDAFCFDALFARDEQVCIIALRDDRFYRSFRGDFMCLFPIMGDCGIALIFGFGVWISLSFWSGFACRRGCVVGRHIYKGGFEACGATLQVRYYRCLDVGSEVCDYEFVNVGGLVMRLWADLCTVVNCVDVWDCGFRCGNCLVEDCYNIGWMSTELFAGVLACWVGAVTLYEYNYACVCMSVMVLGVTVWLVCGADIRLIVALQFEVGVLIAGDCHLCVRLTSGDRFAMRNIVACRVLLRRTPADCGMALVMSLWVFWLDSSFPYVHDCCDYVVEFACALGVGVWCRVGHIICGGGFAGWVALLYGPDDLRFDYCRQVQDLVIGLLVMPVGRMTVLGSSYSCNFIYAFLVGRGLGDTPKCDDICGIPKGIADLRVRLCGIALVRSLHMETLADPLGGFVCVVGVVCCQNGSLPRKI